MANTTTSVLSQVIQSYYDKKLLDMLTPQLVFYEDAVKKPLPRGKGKSITFTRFKDFAGAELLAEGTAPTAAALSAENVSTIIFQIGKHTVLTDVLETTAIDPIVEDAIEVIKMAAAKAVDKGYGRLLLWRRTSMSATLGIGAGAGYCLSAIGQLSSTQFQIPLIRNGSGNCNILAASGIHSSAVLTVSLLRQVTKHLESRNAPTFEDGFYHAVANPAALSVLRATSAWIDLNKYTNLKPLTGEVGTCQNIRFKKSTNAPQIDSAGAKVSANGGGTTHITIVYGKGAYGASQIDNLKGRVQGAQIIVKRSGEQTISDPLNQTPHTIGWKFTGAVKVLNVSCIIGVLTGKGDDTLAAV